MSATIVSFADEEICLFQAGAQDRFICSIEEHKLMKGKTRIFIVILTAILSSLIIYEGLIVHNTLVELGLFGVFFASLLSNLTVVGRDMFVPLFLPLSTVYHPLVLGLAAAWGGALGMVTTYYWGKGIAEAMQNTEEADPVSQWLKRHGIIAILIVAATPLPDTPVVLLAGSSRFSLLKLLLIEGSGKTLWYTFSAFLGGTIFSGLTDLIGGYLTSVIIVAASIIFCIVTSWKKSRDYIARLFGRTVLRKLFRT